VLLGNLYGEVYLQQTISAYEFSVLTTTAKAMRVNDAHLLNELYEYDANAVPPVFCLKVPSLAFNAMHHALACM